MPVLHSHQNRYRDMCFGSLGSNFVDTGVCTRYHMQTRNSIRYNQLRLRI